MTKPIEPEWRERFKDVPVPTRHWYRLGLSDKWFTFDEPPWDLPDKLIIGVAPYGIFIDREMNPFQPIYPHEIIKEFEECIPLGAVALHTHARDEKGNINDPDKASQFLHSVIDPIKKKYGRNVVFDGGIAYYGKTVEENLFPVTEGLYEVAIVNPALGQMGEYIRVYTPRVIQAQAEYCEAHGVKPLIDIHDTHDIWNAKKWLIDTGILSRPTFWHILGPMPGGFIYMPNVESMIEGLLYIVKRIKEIDKEAIILVTQPSRPSIYFIALAILMGLHVRVGMEDTLWKYPHSNELCTSNAEIVKATSDIARALGRRPATADEYRKMIGIR
ncbi:MAG: 3-keto-5-aminohexanoate cleavage protein [Aigarchaeota archaeon]|nr:3-keto-5-aminohexanoate cleavage protein [Aigarchaeota archaeon]MDW8092915.1 3-keto-5-aminohexanoate cleavage protein [Nitrososphaerota archaeon]